MRFQAWIQSVGADAIGRQDAYASWLRDTWGGNEHSVVAYCLHELNEAFGREWGSLPKSDQMNNIQFFSTFCCLYRRPDGDTFYLVAEEYRDRVGPGNLRVFSEELGRLYNRLRK